MKFGMNLLLVDRRTARRPAAGARNAQEAGLRRRRIADVQPRRSNYAAWGRRLDDLGLQRTAVTVRGVDDNPISPDAAVASQGGRDQQAGARLLRGGRVPRTLVGPYHSALGLFTGKGPTQDEWKWGVDSMRQVAEHAGKVERDAGRRVPESV